MQQSVLLPGVDVTFENDFPTHAEFVDAAVLAYNAHSTSATPPAEVVTVMSRLSTADNLGNVFDTESATLGFSYEDLCVCGVHPPIWLAASCHGADYCTSERTAFGWPFCEELLWSGRGIAVVGPSHGK